MLENVLPIRLAEVVEREVLLRNVSRIKKRCHKNVIPRLHFRVAGSFLVAAARILTSRLVRPFGFYPKGWASVPAFLLQRSRLGNRCRTRVRVANVTEPFGCERMAFRASDCCTPTLFLSRPRLHFGCWPSHPGISAPWPAAMGLGRQRLRHFLRNNLGHLKAATSWNRFRFVTANRFW
jgi:hypothetical protein